MLKGIAILIFLILITLDLGTGKSPFSSTEILYQKQKYGRIGSSVLPSFIICDFETNFNYRISSLFVTFYRIEPACKKSYIS
jgi:hypothetical protein